MPARPPGLARRSGSVVYARLWTADDSANVPKKYIVTCFDLSSDALAHRSSLATTLSVQPGIREPWVRYLQSTRQSSGRQPILSPESTGRYHLLAPEPGRHAFQAPGLSNSVPGQSVAPERTLSHQAKIRSCCVSGNTSCRFHRSKTCSCSRSQQSNGQSEVARALRVCCGSCVFRVMSRSSPRSTCTSQTRTWLIPACWQDASNSSLCDPVTA